MFFSNYCRYRGTLYSEPRTDFTGTGLETKKPMLRNTQPKSELVCEAFLKCQMVIQDPPFTTSFELGLYLNKTNK